MLAARQQRGPESHAAAAAHALQSLSGHMVEIGKKPTLPPEPSSTAATKVDNRHLFKVTHETLSHPIGEAATEPRWAGIENARFIRQGNLIAFATSIARQLGRASSLAEVDCLPMLTAAARFLSSYLDARKAGRDLTSDVGMRPSI